MKPYYHAVSSARKYGGKWEDYLPIHDFMDSTKSAHASVKHRAVLHSAFGCFIVERVFGTIFTNSAGKIVNTRDIAEQHCIEDLGRIPSLDEWLSGMSIESWMGQPQRKVTKFDLEEITDGVPREIQVHSA